MHLSHNKRKINSYFLLCLGDSNWGGEQSPKGAQDIGVGVKPKVRPQNVKNPSFGPRDPTSANPLNYCWQMKIKLFLLRLVIVITGLDMKNHKNGMVLYGIKNFHLFQENISITITIRTPSTTKWNHLNWRKIGPIFRQRSQNGFK